MDGSFVDLAADFIESELEEYWQELYKVQRLFGTRAKKQQLLDDNMTRRAAAANTEEQLLIQATEGATASTAAGAAVTAVSAAAAAVAEGADAVLQTSKFTVIAPVQEMMKTFKV